MAKITLSSPLRRFCNQQSKLEGKGETVLELISDATRNYPELRKKILKSDTKLHSQVLVYINARILLTSRERTEVDDETEINLLLIVGGG